MKAYKLILLAVLTTATVFTAIFAGLDLVQSRQVSAMQEQSPVIVIDAGHGGEDGGAVAQDGIKESHLNLSIAQRVDDFLVFSGFETKMIRDSDVSVYDDSARSISEKKVSDLHNRVRTVNETPGALLLSIHQNKFPESRYSGAQVFYAGTSGSKELAQRMQQTLITVADPTNHRQAKAADTVFLMNKIQCTGVLVECGFLSNADEKAKLQDPNYQKKLTLAMAVGLTGWLDKEKNTNEV